MTNPKEKIGTHEGVTTFLGSYIDGQPAAFFKDEKGKALPSLGVFPSKPGELPATGPDQFWAALWSEGATKIGEVKTNPFLDFVKDENKNPMKARYGFGSEAHLLKVIRPEEAPKKNPPVKKARKTAAK